MDKSNIDEVKDPAIELDAPRIDEYKVEEPEVIHEEKPNAEQRARDEDSPDPVKDLIIDVVRETLDFFFKKDVHIVAIGDSLTQGIGDDSGEGGYIDILDKTINREEDRILLSNFGKRGNRTDQLIKRLDEPEIITAIEDADLILMTIGANDIMQVVKNNITNLTYDKFIDELTLYEERLTRIFEIVNELNPNTHIYLLGFYNPFDQYFNEVEELDLIIDNWNESSEEITKSFENVTFIPIKDLFDDSTVNLFADDHFHPNRIGYHRIAARVLDYLTE